jgi:hypothetical protein
MSNRTVSMGDYNLGPFNHLKHEKLLIRDTFRGDNKLLSESIKALIELNDSNALMPHGIGGHARTLLASCYHRLPNK